MGGAGKASAGMRYRRVMVIGAHPDDELTMGATMAMLADRGVRVFVAIMTDGSEGYPRPELKDRIVEIRRAEQEKADRVLGVEKRFHVGAPDQGLGDSKEYLLRLIRAIREARPDALFIHGPSDAHRDHRAAHRLSLDAHFHAGEPVNAELGGPHRVPHLYLYKGTSGLSYPRVDLNVTDYGPRWVEAMLTQRSQFTVFRSVEADFRRLAADFRAGRARRVESFWIHERTELGDLLPLHGRKFLRRPNTIFERFGGIFRA
ncbi:MAG: PIG-L family deacetylase [Planctomycetota bacterium]|nr:PIG-L family deacetylase [Planctomycetota bacterium]